MRKTHPTGFVKESSESSRMQRNLNELSKKLSVHKEEEMIREQLLAYGREFYMYRSGLITLEQAEANCNAIDFMIRTA